MSGPIGARATPGDATAGYGARARLDPGIYALDAEALAIALLGQVLVRRLGERRLSGEIVETEAYVGPQDLAAHTRGGLRSARNRSMWRGGGHVYVYSIYGMHRCVNVVAGAVGSGAAVLVRAIRPLEGIDVMRAHRRLATPGGEVDRRLAGGPARLTQAMAIDLELDGEDLRHSESVWIEAGEPCARPAATPRIGVDSAQEWAAASLRFVDPRSAAWLSRRWPPAEAERKYDRTGTRA